MPHKYSCSPEAANDLSYFLLDNPERKFHHASIENFDIHGAPKQTLRLHYELVGYEFGKDYNTYSIVEMAIDGVMEMLKFSFTTIASAYHLSHENRLVDCNPVIKPVQS